MIDISHFIWAKLNGYFWAPCPRCGKMFGGHQARWENSDNDTEHSGLLTCPQCPGIRWVGPMANRLKAGEWQG